MDQEKLQEMLKVASRSQYRGQLRRHVDFYLPVAGNNGSQYFVEVNWQQRRRLPPAMGVELVDQAAEFAGLMANFFQLWGKGLRNLHFQDRRLKQHDVEEIAALVDQGSRQIAQASPLGKLGRLALEIQPGSQGVRAHFQEQLYF